MLSPKKSERAVPTLDSFVSTDPYRVRRQGITDQVDTDAKDTGIPDDLVGT